MADTMTLRDAARKLGINRSKFELQQMKKALSLHSWNNTAEEKERLSAVTYALDNWSAYQQTCEKLRAELRRGIG